MKLERIRDETMRRLVLVFMCCVFGVVGVGCTEPYEKFGDDYDLENKIYLQEFLTENRDYRISFSGRSPVDLYGIQEGVSGVIKNIDGEVMSIVHGETIVGDYVLRYGQTLKVLDGRYILTVVKPGCGCSKPTGKNIFLFRKKQQKSSNLNAENTQVKPIDDTKNTNTEKTTITSKPSDTGVSLSLTGLLAIIVMCAILNKIIDKINLKSIFGFTKKAGRNIKDEWDKS